MSVDLRVKALRDLIELRVPLPTAINQLRRFPWDSDTPLTTLTGLDLLRVLNGYLRGELSDADLEGWAEAIEGRDDIAYELQLEGTLRQIIFEFANPLLTSPIEPDRARRWRDAISAARWQLYLADGANISSRLGDHRSEVVCGVY